MAHLRLSMVHYSNNLPIDTTSATLFNHEGSGYRSIQLHLHTMCAVFHKAFGDLRPNVNDDLLCDKHYMQGAIVAMAAKCLKSS